MHQPWMAATTGLRQSATALMPDCIRLIMSWNAVRGPACALSARTEPKLPLMAGRSRPKEKFLPEPAITTARTSGSASSSPKISGSSLQKSGPIALPFPGPMSVTCAT